MENDIKEEDIINVLELQDGDIAQIISWGNKPRIINRIVQRYNCSLISVNMPCGNSWGGLFNCNKKNSIFNEGEYLVKLLKKCKYD